MNDPLKAAGIECTQELAAALVKTASEVMAKHGNDPDSGAILAAGFGMALQNIGKHIDPLVPKTVREFLAQS